MRYLVSIMVLGVGLAACAPGSPPRAPPGSAEQATAGRTPNRCLNTGRIVNFRMDRGSRLFVRSARNDVHEIIFIGGCRLNPSSAIRISGSMPGVLQACVGDRVTVTAPMQRGVSCQARVTRALTETQIADLAPRLRP